MLSTTPYIRRSKRLHRSIWRRALVMLAILLTIFLLVTVRLYFQLRDIFAPQSGAPEASGTSAAEVLSGEQGGSE